MGAARSGDGVRRNGCDGGTGDLCGRSKAGLHFRAERQRRIGVGTIPDLHQNAVLSKRAAGSKAFHPRLPVQGRVETLVSTGVFGDFCRSWQKLPVGDRTSHRLRREHRERSGILSGAS